MNLSNNPVDFYKLLPPTKAQVLLQRIEQLSSNVEASSIDTFLSSKRDHYSNKWRQIHVEHADKTLQIEANSVTDSEQVATDWLINLFNDLFIDQHVVLVRSNGEPEYFPAQDTHPARIEFAHGFFASALHELSHWCVAGDARRCLPDFGYWYAPDGRTAAQQQAFERVEIKPQALECLFTLACGRQFQVSQDNLFADFDTSSSTFADDVYQQVERYIADPHTLPRDAKTLLHALLNICAAD
ncbi:elongation factor P hydroxylase [Psychrobacter sp. NG254]|uniref:elongation factor P hydroxylase n=1 Tax=Psychrobacter sp. NG254 TaxID=2782003 RepID=UPI001D0F602D|nr:elongation factor P hydroxylase [Psychrobacter sp. NG254]